MCSSCLTIDSALPDTPLCSPGCLLLPLSLSDAAAAAAQSALVSVFYQAFKFVDNMLRLIAKNVCTATSLTLPSLLPRTIPYFLSLTPLLPLYLCVSVTVEQID